MRLTETRIAGLFAVSLTPLSDERGHFARTFCRDTFAAHGIAFTPLQCSLSFNRHRHTLRGMHWQAEPHGETKLVRATRGAAFDVAVDLREGSPTRLAWVAAHLSAANGEGLLIPPGCAHGFLTLEPDTELFYMMDAPFVAASARGARFDDPAFGIDWPHAPAVIADKDRGWPLT